MKQSVRLTISGSIQPILFNQFIKEHADIAHLNGFVRNLGDGKAEIFVEGESSLLPNFLAICKRGPPHAFIRNTTEKEEKFQGFKEFKIINF